MDQQIKIGLISDVHATCAPVREALSVFRRQHVDRIWCAGDIAGYGVELGQTVELLMESGCRAVRGNHEMWYLEEAGSRVADPVADYFSHLPAVLDTEVAGKRLYMVHASPPRSYLDGIRLLNEYGEIIQEQKQAWEERLQDFDRDVLIVGHTHQVFCERLGDTVVVNPGSTCFNHSCAILTLPDGNFEVFALSGKAVSSVWNWGLMRT